jgi:hypothetical protein
MPLLTTLIKVKALFSESYRFVNGPKAHLTALDIPDCQHIKKNEIKSLKLILTVTSPAF